MNDTKKMEGLVVTGFLPNSIAAKAGVLRGDEVFSVNGQPIKTFQDFADAHSLNKTGMELTVLRNGKVLDLSMKFGTEKRDFAQAIREFIASMNPFAKKESN